MNNDDVIKGAIADAEDLTNHLKEEEFNEIESRIVICTLDLPKIVWYTLEKYAEFDKSTVSEIISNITMHTLIYIDESVKQTVILSKNLTGDN